MLDPQIYTWYAAYHAAVLEPSSAKMQDRVNAALAEMEARFTGPAQLDGAEEQAIDEARAQLVAVQSRAN
jgi:hypothetical protein